MSVLNETESTHVAELESTGRASKKKRQPKRPSLDAYREEVMRTARAFGEAALHAWVEHEGKRESTILSRACDLEFAVKALYEGEGTRTDWRTEDTIQALYSQFNAAFLTIADRLRSRELTRIVCDYAPGDGEDIITIRFPAPKRG